MPGAAGPTNYQEFSIEFRKSRTPQGVKPLRCKGFQSTPGRTRTPNLLIRSQDAHRREAEISVLDQQRDQQFRS